MAKTIFTKETFIDIGLIGIISILGTFLFDLVVSHLIVYGNLPDILTYFIAVKLIPSFLIMTVFYLLILKVSNKMRRLAWFVGVPIGILIFVAFVQLYYGIFPIPLLNGGEVVNTIANSFKGGYVVHAFDYLISFIIVSAIFRKWRK